VREGEDLMRRLQAEAVECYEWSSRGGDEYPPHRHTYRKILYCVSGSIRFDLTDERRSIELRKGDRLELPPGTLHAAAVGPDGVTCIEGKGR
jgi:quercetin dioxygenase-like cupin family protein